MAESNPNGWALVRAFGALLLLLAIIGAGVYALVVALDHLRSGVAAGVVTASATVLVSVFTVVWSRRADRRRSVEETARERKLPVYDELLQFWMELTLTADELTPDEILERFKKFNRERLHTLILWMPESVLTAYNRFRAVTVPEAGRAVDQYALIFTFEDLLLAVRKDLGHSDAEIKRGDLLRLWINDVDEALAATLSQPSAEAPAEPV